MVSFIRWKQKNFDKNKELTSTSNWKNGIPTKWLNSCSLIQTCITMFSQIELISEPPDETIIFHIQDNIEQFI